MSTEANKAVVQRFFDEVLNQMREVTAEEIIAPDSVTHHPAFPEGIRGPAGTLQAIGGFRAGFPDLQYAIDDLIAEGDKVVARWTAQGTHEGPFMRIPPTGKTMRITGTDVFVLRRGQCVECWVQSDFLGLMQQIGAIPSPPPAEELD
jgi:steroid delta-isomerase-like uncharacterized protein